MTQPGEPPLPVTVTPPVTTPTPAPVAPPVGPLVGSTGTPVTSVTSATPPVPTIDDSAARAQLDDLQMQESVVAQLLDIIEEAGRQVSDSAPRWVDPDVFGDTHEGRRMARHTVRAQVRVHQALDLAVEALAQHHGSLATFRDEVRRVEATAAEELAAVRARVDGTRS